MAETVHKVHKDIVRSQDDPDLVTNNDVVATPRSGTAALTTLQRVISILASLLVAALTLRLIMVLLGANPDNAFANAIYNITNPFISVFRGLFNIRSDLGTNGHFETETLVAIIAYSLLAWGIVSLLDLGHIEENI